MEPPASFGAKDIRDAKVSHNQKTHIPTSSPNIFCLEIQVKVLQAISPITPEDTLLGQYVAAKGKPGYLDDDTVPKGSKCPTFAATTLYIKNERWEGVPFILIAGKGMSPILYDGLSNIVIFRSVFSSLSYVFSALDEAKVEVRIQFKDVNEGAFNDIPRNELVFRIQPSEAVYLKINAKVPGLHTRALPTNMDLTYKRQFPESKIPDAYEVLILDALRGDSSNFVRDDELDGAWKVRSACTHVRFCSFY
jgi:glucose-6-phosphate 1-dehydrogenase